MKVAIVKLSQSLTMNHLAASGRGINENIFFISPQGDCVKTHLQMNLLNCAGIYAGDLIKQLFGFSLIIK